MASKYKEPFVYGKHPNPTNWHEAADALRSIKPKRPGLRDMIEKLLKEKK